MRHWKMMELDNDGNLRSRVDGSLWKPREERVYTDDAIDFNSGYHCSPTPFYAWCYGSGTALALVETDGEHKEQIDRSVWERMRIIEAWKWDTKLDHAILSMAQQAQSFERETVCILNAFFFGLLTTLERIPRYSDHTSEYFTHEELGSCQ